MRTALLFLLFVCSLFGGAGDRYASPFGRPDGDGSIGKPWDLTTALGAARVEPGQTLWLRGGAYAGVYYSRLEGTAQAPITVRSYPGERALLVDFRPEASPATLNIRGAWTIFQDFDVTNVSPDRLYRTQVYRRPMGVEVVAPHVKLVNLVVHDTGHIGFWKEAVDSEIYGCIIFNAGQFDPEAGSGRAAKVHGIYTQNNEGTKLIADNLIFNQFGWGIHAYPNPGDLDGFRIEGNVVFNNGRWAGAGLRYNNLLVNGYSPYAAGGVSIANNFFHHSASQQPIGKYSDANVCLACADPVTNDDIAFKDNYVVNGIPGIFMGSWKQLTVTGNTIVSSKLAAGFTYGAMSKIQAGEWNRNRYFVAGPATSAFTLEGRLMGFDQWRRKTGYDSSSQITLSRPSGTEVFVRPNRYEAGRAHIVVLNWSQASFVDVDLSGTLRAGDEYEVRNVQSFRGAAVVRGTYRGGKIRTPLNAQTVASPIGMPFSAAAEDEMQAFLVQKVQPSTDPGALVGVYQTLDGQEAVRVERSGDALFVVVSTAEGSPRIPLSPLVDRVFRLEGLPEGVIAQFEVVTADVMALVFASASGIGVTLRLP